MAVKKLFRAIFVSRFTLIAGSNFGGLLMVRAIRRQHDASVNPIQVYGATNRPMLRSPLCMASFLPEGQGSRYEEIARRGHEMPTGHFLLMGRQDRSTVPLGVGEHRLRDLCSNRVPIKRRSRWMFRL